MQPKFKDIAAWEQAQLLMQPAFIRVVDNLRQQLELSTWQGIYQEIDQPYPGYQLCLTKQDRVVKVDIWQLCFQVCFCNYRPPSSDSGKADPASSQEVEIDTSLIRQTGEVDWHRLETKVQHLVSQIFANLPTDLRENDCD